MANVLISSEKIAYEEDEKIMRGVLDAEKLDDVFVKDTNAASVASAFIQPKDIGIGYPNSFIVVRVVDLEKCDASYNCEGWIVSLSTPISLQGLTLTKFLTCIAEHVRLDLGYIFRAAATPILGPIIGLWQPQDLKNCVQNNIPSGFKSIFSSSEIAANGFPVLIRYPDGKLHVGRISVLVGEWWL